MRFIKGQKVLIKPNAEELSGNVGWAPSMEKYLNETVTIRAEYYDHYDDYYSYSIEEDDGGFTWDEDMFTPISYNKRILTRMLIHGTITESEYVSLSRL